MSAQVPARENPDLQALKDKLEWLEQEMQDLREKSTRYNRASQIRWRPRLRSLSPAAASYREQEGFNGAGELREQDRPLRIHHARFRIRLQNQQSELV
jgi:hypothetical protein